MLKSSLKDKSTGTRFESLYIEVTEKSRSVFNLPLSKVISYCSLVEPLSFVEKLGNVFWSVSEELVLHQKHNALQAEPLHSSTVTKQAQTDGCVHFYGYFFLIYLFRVHVEFFPSHCHMPAFL